MDKNLISGGNTLVPLFDGTKVPYINFDNAATTPPFNSVLKAIESFSSYYSSVHRGTGYKSILSSKIYDEGRDAILDFVNGDKSYHTAIFLKNTTECINKLSYRLKDTLKDKIVLSTYMEHHSNLLPWKYRYNTDYIEVDNMGRLSIENLEYKLRKHKGKVGLVAVTGASNVTGYLNPIHDIAEIAHKYGAKILVDGAQLIPHSPFDMKDIHDPKHIDYITFSGHKMYAPFGVGVLIAPKETFNKGYSEQIGGGTVDLVTMDEVVWANPPEKEEAGTPNLMGVVAIVQSIKTLNLLNMKKVEEHERNLTRYALENLKNISSLKIYDDMNVENKVSIISFNMDGIDHETLAKILSKEGGIGVRNGCFCAQPYIQTLLGICELHMEKYKNNKILPRPGMVRLSFGLYNDYSEIDMLIYLLKEINKNKEYYSHKYIKPSFYLK